MKSFLVGVFGLLFVSAAAAAQTCPVNTTPPSISGSPIVGQSLSVSPGAWTNCPLNGVNCLFFQQWYRGTTAIPGETSTTHIASTADVGSALSALVVVSNSSGPAQIKSAATAPVTSGGGGGGGITSKNLTSGITGGGGTSVATASISAAANTIVVASVAGRNNSGATNVAPTLTGAGQTWTPIGNVVDGSGGSRSVAS